MNRGLPALLMVLLAVPLDAQTIPSTTTQAQGPFKLIVTGVQGNAAARATESASWLPVAVGMELFEGAEIRTAHRSVVQFIIPPDQTVRLDRLGTLKILEAKFRDGSYVTELGMKFGRLNYSVEAPETQHQTRVRTPGTTLAVRGTQVSVSDEPPFAPSAMSFTGRAEFRDAKKQVAFGSKGGGKTKVSADKDSAAEFALSESYVDPSISFARTPAEQRLIEQTVSRGGILSFDAVNSIPVIRGGTPFSAEEVLANPPGPLDFILTWSGNADLNLSVALLGLNEIVSPVGTLNRSPSGGTTAFDHRGGPEGGFEVVFWPSNYPGSQPGPGDLETYVAAVQHVSGESTPFRLVVFDGEDAGTVIIDRQGTASPPPQATARRVRAATKTTNTPAAPVSKAKLKRAG
jgi:hypothetical protein